MNRETVMTFASLLVAILATVALVYASFSLGYLVDLLTGRGVPPLRFVGAILVTGACAWAVVVALRYRHAFD